MHPGLFAARQPDLGEVHGLGVGQCARGYLTFEIAAGTSPAGVRYASGPFRTYEWQLPGRPGQGRPASGWHCRRGAYRPEGRRALEDGIAPLPG